MKTSSMNRCPETSLLADTHYKKNYIGNFSGRYIMLDGIFSITLHNEEH